MKSIPNEQIDGECSGAVGNLESACNEVQQITSKKAWSKIHFLLGEVSDFGHTKARKHSRRNTLRPFASQYLLDFKHTVPLCLDDGGIDEVVCAKEVLQEVKGE